jgi:hypothetical protein
LKKRRKKEWNEKENDQEETRTERRVIGEEKEVTCQHVRK